MPAEPGEKISINYDDLQTRKVDQRLKEQEALERNRRQSEMNPLAAVIEVPSTGSFWSNTIVVMALFGFLGGLLAWGGGEALRFRTDPRVEARKLMNDVGQITKAQDEGRFSPAEAQLAVAEIKAQGSDNPYFTTYVNSSLSEEQKKAEIEKLTIRKSGGTSSPMC